MSVLNEAMSYARDINLLEFSGLVFGVLCVVFLIRQNILTWICGIIYVLISFVIFWQARLYGDFFLHIFFLVLNIYGWREWTRGDQYSKDTELPVTMLSINSNLRFLGITVLGVLLFALILKEAPGWIPGMEPAALPFWDSMTSVLSITGMWLTAKKKIDNWYYWLVVDILATLIYYYKELYFYSILYFIYIGLAIAGYLAWKKSMEASIVND